MKDQILIEAFVKDEDEALRKGIQGDFYVMNHYKLHPLVNKTLKDVPDTLKRKFYFHIIRLSIDTPAYQIKQANFGILKEAYIDILAFDRVRSFKTGLFGRRPRHYISLPDRIPYTSFYKLNAFFLFRATHYTEENVASIRGRTWEDYIYLNGFIKKSHVYPMAVYSNLQANHSAFLPYCEDPHIMENIRQSLSDQNYMVEPFPANNVFWTFFMTLILAGDEQTLKRIVTANRDERLASVEGGFLKYFSSIDAHADMSERLLDLLNR